MQWQGWVITDFLPHDLAAHQRRLVTNPIASRFIEGTDKTVEVFGPRPADNQGSRFGVLRSEQVRATGNMEEEEPYLTWPVRCRRARAS